MMFGSGGGRDGMADGGVGTPGVPPRRPDCRSIANKADGFCVNGLAAAAGGCC